LQIAIAFYLWVRGDLFCKIKGKTVIAFYHRVKGDLFCKIKGKTVIAFYHRVKGDRFFLNGKGRSLLGGSIFWEWRSFFIALVRGDYVKL
jgi:hypothetical protein